MTKLDIISDPICPWCYIGKTKLDKAMKAHPENDFEIEWHPFQLNPEMPAAGMDRREYLEAKFGGQKGAVDVYSQIVKAATDEGLTINIEGIKRTPSTLNAHRLIHWAGLYQAQGAVVDALFDAYFIKGHDISDINVLVDIADQAGLEGPVIAKMLGSDVDTDGIKARDKHARAQGVRGVPTFVVGEYYVLTGAQPSDLWGKVIGEIARVNADENTDAS